MSSLNWLKPATLAATVVVASILLVAAPVRAQDVTVLRGSPPLTVTTRIIHSIVRLTRLGITSITIRTSITRIMIMVMHIAITDTVYL
jgi:hypothetical protein